MDGDGIFGVVNDTNSVCDDACMMATVSSYDMIQASLLTVVVCVCFVIVKSAYDEV